jgi:hypothetical protein
VNSDSNIPRSGSLINLQLQTSAPDMCLASCFAPLRSRWIGVISLAVIGTASLPAQVRVPIHTVTPVEAASGETVGSFEGGVKQLAHGRLLINDAARQRLVVFDSTLSKVTVLMDSSGNGAHRYLNQTFGSNATVPLIPYRGDSTLFVDMQSRALILIDPMGQPGRVIALPNPRDMPLLVGGMGMPASDARGRLIYRGRPTLVPASTLPGTPPSDTARVPVAPILRADLLSRATDTMGFVQLPRPPAKTTSRNATSEIGRAHV